VISGWILKAEYWLYTNSTDLRPVYFPGIFDVNGIGPLNSFGRKRRDADPDEFEDGGVDYNYGEEETIIPEKVLPKDNQLMDGEITRWLFYKSLETWATHKGYVGKPCVLRAICESAQVPFTYENGLLGELLHILMT
jgi:DM4/DM12 family